MEPIFWPGQFNATTAAIHQRLPTRGRIIPINFRRRTSLGDIQAMVIIIDAYG